MDKSTLEQIRNRFDQDVERFSNLETGQTATIDAPLAMDLIAQTAATVTPAAKHVLDLGCGAGNYTLKLLQYFPHLEVTLVDLSAPMLERAKHRIAQINSQPVQCLQTDLLSLRLLPESCDIVLASAVLHHLRDDAEWESVFRHVFEVLRPGGAFWIFDLVTSDHSGVQQIMWENYGKYLSDFKDDAYRDHVFAYIEQEDSPRSLMYQLRLLEQSGFRTIDVLHKHGPFAAFGGIK